MGLGPGCGMYIRNLWVSLPCCISGFLNGATFPEPCGSFRTSSRLDYCVRGSWLQVLRPEPGMSGRSFPLPTQPWTPRLHIQEVFREESCPKSFCQLARDQDKEHERLCNLLPIHFTHCILGASGRTRQLCVERIKGARDKDVSKLTVLTHSFFKCTEARRGEQHCKPSP